MAGRGRQAELGGREPIVIEGMSGDDRPQLGPWDHGPSYAPVTGTCDVLALVRMTSKGIRYSAKSRALEAAILLANNLDAAVAGLMPVALGPWGKDRRDAEFFMRSQAAAGHCALLEQESGRFGERGLEALREIVASAPALPPTDPAATREIMSRLQKQRGFRPSLLDELGAQTSDLASLSLFRLTAGDRVNVATQRRAALWLDLHAARRRLSWSALELATLPDLGLDEQGLVVLDFGPRKFAARLTDQLSIELTGDGGVPVKSLPRPRRSDDAIKAKAAAESLSELRKALRSFVSLEKTRLENAMAWEQVWDAEQFQRRIMGNPVTRRLARLLVWCASDGKSAPIAFHLDEHDSPRDVDGNLAPVELNAEFKVAHPVLLGDESASWLRRFAELGIEQPFRQLLRTIYRRDDDSFASFFGLHGAMVTTVGMLWLERTGWMIGGGDGNWDHKLERGFSEGFVSIEFDPPLYVVRGLSEDYIDRKDSREGTHRIDKLHFPNLSPVNFSEVIRQLQLIRLD